MQKRFSALTFVSAVLLSQFMVMADITMPYKDCAKPIPTEFKTTALVGYPTRFTTGSVGVRDSGAFSLLRFDLLKNGNDYDIYYGGFEGVLYRYDSQLKKVTIIHDFKTIQGSVGSPYNSGDHGLTGIIFHPDFSKNRWIFVMYTPMVAGNQNRVMRLSRFELTPQLDKLQNEKILLSLVAHTTDMWHSGGDMRFTAQGDLYLQVGDNVADDVNNTDKTHNAAWTAANTTNLLGGIVRIHPDSSTKGYSIPKNNFGEYFAPLENNSGYLDTNRVRPEIYVKGQRSNFTATGHPVDQIHIWGEVCTASSYDEINVINHPEFTGWPFFQGDATTNLTGGSATNRYAFTLNDKPVLTTAVAGTLVGPNAIQTLPSIYPADIVVGSAFNVVMVQALYYYGEAEAIVPNRTFPPHFNESFIFSAFGGSNARMVPIIKKGTDVTAEMKDASYGIVSLFSTNSSTFNGMTEAKFGPDGALYVLSRGGQYGKNTPGLISRVDYIGTCQDPALFATNRNAMAAAKAASLDAGRYRQGFFDPSLYSTTAIGKAKMASLHAGEALYIRVFNLMGQFVGSNSTVIKTSGDAYQWDGRFENGHKIKQGLYFIQYLNAKDQVLMTHKHAF